VAGQNLRVDPSDESVGCQEANSAREQSIGRTGQEAVAEEEHTGDEALDVQFEEVVPDAVGEDPNGRASTHRK
jgi:hypothetical protein